MGAKLFQNHFDIFKLATGALHGRIGKGFVSIYDRLIGMFSQYN